MQTPSINKSIMMYSTGTESVKFKDLKFHAPPHECNFGW